MIDERVTFGLQNRDGSWLHASKLCSAFISRLEAASSFGWLILAMSAPVASISCLLVGLTSGYLAAHFSEDSPAGLAKQKKQSIDVRPFTDLDNGSSPFAIVDDETFSSATVNRYTERTTSRDARSGIDYDSLQDYNYLLDTLARVSVAEQSSLLDWIGDSALSSTVAPDMATIRRAMFQRLSEIAPTAAKEWIDRRVIETAGNHVDVLLDDAVIGYSQAHANIAKTWLAELDEWRVQQLSMANFVKALAKVEPEAVLVRLGTNEAHGVAGEIVDGWAIRDADSAYDWLANRASSEQWELYEAMVLGRLIRQHPDKALARLQEIPSGQISPWMFGEHASAMARINPQAALDWALELDDPDVLEHTTIELVMNWPDDELDLLRDRIDTISDESVRERVAAATASRIMERISQNDLTAMMEWVHSNSKSIQSMLKPQAVSIWLRRDPAGAVAWLREQSGTVDYPALIESAMWALPEHDLDLALDTFPSMISHEQFNLVDSMVVAIQRDRPSATRSWIAGISDPHVRGLASRILSERTLLADPDQLFYELDTASASDRIKKIAGLYQFADGEDVELLDQWLFHNPLSPDQELALERELGESWSNGSTACL